MSAERHQLHRGTQLWSDEYYAERDRVLDLQELLHGLGYGATRRFEKDDASGYLYLLEDNRIDIDEFKPGVDLSPVERHHRIDDTIRRYRSSGDDRYFGVINRQLPGSVQRLTISVLHYTAGTEQTSWRTRHQLSWRPESSIVVGKKLVTTSLADQSDVILSAADFGDARVDSLGTDPNLPYLMPGAVTDTTFDDLEQEVYSLAARVRTAA